MDLGKAKVASELLTARIGDLEVDVKRLQAKTTTLVEGGLEAYVAGF